MSESIHGHAVMEMMLSEGGQFSEGSLKQAMATRFGADARYHTCRMSNLDADGLIAFLRERGKFIDSEQGFQTHADKICRHG